MIGYLLALLPLYIFVYVPVSQFLSPSSLSSSSSSHDNDTFNSSFIAPEDLNLICPQHTYTTTILSREPLVLYLENWLSASEISELLEISADHFAPSHVSTGPDHFIDPAIRRSEVATIPRSPTVRCIEARARALQGWGYHPPPTSTSPFAQGWSLFSGTRSAEAQAQSQAQKPIQDTDGQDDPDPGPRRREMRLEGLGVEPGLGTGAQPLPLSQPEPEPEPEPEGGLLLERLKIQRYGPGGHYTHHYDWQGGPSRVDRVSSFMVYVDANCTGGGTAFPRLPRPMSRRWCRFIECEEGDEGKGMEGEEDGQGQGQGQGHEQQQRQQQGVTFKPVRGNAVFWENLRADGTGYVETWHAGLPVETGTKIGLNIWTWYRF